MAAVPMLLVALGAISLGIGVAYMRTETKMRFHLFWVALGFALVALGAAMATGVWYVLPAVVRLFVYAALGVFALYELGAHALILRHFRDMAAPGLDYVVVLGAQVFDSGPGRTLATRLDAACAYLAANPQTRCITCGGQGHSEPTSEARAGADYLAQRGIDPARIILEERSHSTLQNLCNAAALVDPAHDRVGIATNDYHMFRALYLARKAGFARAEGIAAKAPAHFPINNTVRETFALVKDFIR